MLAKTLENEQLFNIQKQYPADIIELPGYEDVGYKIDLSTRDISSPEFLSVKKDHNAEVIYFVIDRYFDYKDLSTATCIIQYKNANGESFVYPVQFFDTYTLRESNRMIIPWNVSGNATEYAGDITYSFRFYEFEAKKDEMGNFIYDENNNLIYTDKLVYNLNTRPAVSKILYGLDIEFPNSEIPYDPDVYEQILAILSDENRKVIYWNMLD